jgi:hypothetical protein
MVELKAELIVVNDLWLLPAIGPCILALEKKKLQYGLRTHSKQHSFMRTDTISQDMTIELCFHVAILFDS